MFYLNNLCSLCLAPNKKFTSRSSIDSNAEDMLERIIPEFMQKSEIPRKLCDDCLGSLTTVFDFRRKCLVNINIFDEYIRKLKLVYGSYKHLSVTITDIKHFLNKEICEEIILDESTCFLEDDLSTDYLKKDDNIMQENSYHRASNEEREENDQKSDIVFDIKKEIKEIILVDTFFLQDDLRTDCLKTDDNIKQENSYNRESNEEQEENNQKSVVAFNIKKEINKEIILDENTYFLQDDVRTDLLKIDDNIKQKNSYIRESNEGKEENDHKSDVTLSIFYESDTGNTIEPENQDVDCEERSRCTKCGKEFYNRMNDTDPPKCQKCQTILGNTNTLNKPKRVKSVNKPYECNTCHKTFRLPSRLKAHERIHGEKLLSCGLCEKKFKQPQSVKLHQLVHAKHRPFVCNICQKTFASAQKLRKHSLTHSNKKSFECYVCKKLYKTAVGLQKHKITHTGIRPFKCEICQNRFFQKDHLILHKRIHTGETPFQCNLCEKSFTQHNGLQYHIKTHGNERPFECNICKKKFRSANNLRLHKLLHSKERPFKCSICEKRFVSNAALKNHNYSHNKEKAYLCTTCQRSFSKLSHLRAHKTTHTGERPFPCDVCPLKFRLAGNLRRHKLIHDGIKPFECGVCGQSFHRSAHRAQHERIHH